MSDILSSTNRKERIELHCHTKAGGNATMYAGEVIRMMSAKNILAIVFTDCSSIISYTEIENVMKYE